jgi:hypothetical protein
MVSESWKLESVSTLFRTCTSQNLLEHPNEQQMPIQTFSSKNLDTRERNFHKGAPFGNRIHEARMQHWRGLVIPISFELGLFVIAAEKCQQSQKLYRRVSPSASEGNQLYSGL